MQNEKQPIPTGTEASVCEDIAKRQQLGLNKYGTTVAGNPLDLRQWLQHAYEEALDLSIYLKKSMEELDTIFPTPQASLIPAQFDPVAFDERYDTCDYTHTHHVGCKQCAFFKNCQQSLMAEERPECSPDMRLDKRNVYFVEKEKFKPPASVVVAASFDDRYETLDVPGIDTPFKCADD